MIEHTDVACWIVKGDPKTWDYFTALDEDESEPIRPHVYANGWTLGNNYRNGLIRKDDLIALWITGPKNPGVYEVGYVISDEAYEVDGFDDRYALDLSRSQKPCWAVDYGAVRLGGPYVPRSEMKAHPVLSGAEQFRAPQGANPSYLDHEQARALAQLVADRLPSAQVKAAKWDRLLR